MGTFVVADPPGASAMGSSPSMMTSRGMSKALSKVTGTVTWDPTATPAGNAAKPAATFADTLGTIWDLYASRVPWGAWPSSVCTFSMPPKEKVTRTLAHPVTTDWGERRHLSRPRKGGEAASRVISL